jgi:hypothetical protein
MDERQHRSARGRQSRHDLAKEQSWRRRLEAHGASGLSVRAFCRREGLAEPRFYWWRREIARRDTTAQSRAVLPREEFGTVVSPREERNRESGGLRPPKREAPRGNSAVADSPPVFAELRLVESVPPEIHPSRSSQPPASTASRNALASCAQSLPSQSLPSSVGQCALGAVEVVLRGGRTLRVWRGFDAGLLLEVARLLESEVAPC